MTTVTQTTTATPVLQLRAEHQSTPRESIVDGWYRGDKAKTIPAQRIGFPEFVTGTDKESLLQKRQWVKEHLALCFRMWGKLGYSQGVAGHITVRDPVLPDHFWINPFGVHFSAITVSKLVLVGPDGYVSPIGAQLPINEAGFAIHSAIHKARPEVNSAAHCHTQYGRAWSVFGKPVEVNNQDATYFYKNQGIYLDGGRVALEADEGQAIADALGATNRTGILQNHGLITLGDTCDEAMFLFNTLEKQCQIQLLVEAAAAGGLKKTVISDKDAEYTVAEMRDPECLYTEIQPDIELFREKYPAALL